MLNALAEHLHVEPSSIRRRLDEMLGEARSGALTDQQVEDMDAAVDLLQRMDAFDHPWVFGGRYMRHKFVSTDPVCRNCRNEVPHRTILVCPTCGVPGPWAMEEHTVKSSYIHYLLTEQVCRLLGTSLLLGGGKHFADGIITAMPRGGAKSTWMCEIVGSWLVLTGRSRCLLILSNTIEQVTDRCNEVKTELEDNETIIADFGVQAARRQDPRTWSKADFILPNQARVVGRGAMQTMRGVKNKEYRPDVVIGDDSDDEKYLTTPEQASKMYEWWDRRVLPACHPNACFIDSGTVIGEMALLYQKLKGARGVTSVRQVFRALEDRPGCSACGMPAPNVGPYDCPVCGSRMNAISPSSYWGARFTVQALEAMKRKIGHWAWQTEYMQSPHDDSTSWFHKDWIDSAYREDLAPLTKHARRIIPWSVLACTLTGDEAVRISTMADRKMAPAPGDIGPYQAMVQAWDPAWARKKGPEQMTAWMAGCGMGLTWDDKFDIFWLDRDRALPGNAAYREWMYRTWREDVSPLGDMDRTGQTAMIIESNGAGVMFQYGIEEHWGSVPLITHQTGAEKHDLTDGIPGLASSYKDGRVIIRGGGSDRQRKNAEELKYELQHSGRSQFTDILMSTWFAWAYLNRWIRDVRDKARWEELVRRNALKQRGEKRSTPQQR